MISIIILTNNKPEYYIPLLDSIICKSKKSEKIQLLIGDTGIGLNNRLYLNAYLKKFHESSKIIEFKYHFSKNNNLLEKYAYYENLLFCNNDIIIDTENFDQIICDGFLDEKIGTIGAKLLYPNKSIQHAGIKIIWDGFNKGLAYHRNRFCNANLKSVNALEEVDANTGAFLAIQKSIFRKVGGFDDAYDEECQDVDLCLKVKTLGLMNLYFPNLVAFHLENGTRELNSSCITDRNRFLLKWNLDFLKKLLNISKKNKAKGILVIRKGARGDVVATCVLLRELKNQEPDITITVQTDFVELASSFDFIDDVINSGENYCEQDYKLVISADYENATWTYVTNGWFEALRYNLGLTMNTPIVDLYKEAGNCLSIKGTTIHDVDLLHRHSKYITISRGAGWEGRRMSDYRWQEELSKYKKRGYMVIEIASSVDKFLPLESVDLVINDAELDFIIQLQKKSEANLVLDSFLMHTAALADENKIKVYTCKTTLKSVFGAQIFDEVRGKLTKDPIVNCSKYGCRFKRGNGLSGECNLTALNRGVLIEISKNRNI